MSDALALNTTRTEDLDAATRAAIIDLCVAAHHNEDFRRLFSYIPRGGQHFLAANNARLVGHAVVTPRWLLLDDRVRLRTAYVDAVATAPDHQGQGVGSALLRFLATRLDAYDLAALETERPTFYERLGWTTWSGPLAGLRNGQTRPLPSPPGVMVLRLAATPPLNVEGTLAIVYDGRYW